MANFNQNVKFTGQFDTTQITKGLQDIKKEISSTHIADDLKKQLESAFNKLEVNIPALEKLTSKEDFNLKDIQALQKLIQQLEKDYANFNKIASEADFTKSFSSADLKKLENFKNQIQNIEKIIADTRQQMINTFAKDKNISGSKNITNALLELFTVKSNEVNNKFEEISKQINDGVEKTGTELQQKLDTLPILKQGKDVIKAFFGEESNVTFAKNQTEVVRKSINDIIREYRRLRELGDKDGMLNQVKELQKILSDPKNFNIPEGESPLGLPTEKDKQSLEIIKNNLKEIIDLSTQKQEFIDEQEKQRIEASNKELELRKEITEDLSKKTPNLTEANNKFNNSLQGTKKQANEAETELQRLQRQGEALEQTFGSLIHRIENSVSALAVFHRSIQIVRQAVKSVEDLDAAFTQIAIVSEQSSEQAWSMFDSFNKLAKQYSITTKDLTEGAKLFYQQGLSAADTMKMVEASTVSAALGEVTMTEAANTLTAAIQGYNESAEVAMAYTDKIAMVGAVSAADFNELSTAMEKTASSAYTAGIDFDHLLGYLGKMIEVTREAPRKYYKNIIFSENF